MPREESSDNNCTTVPIDVGLGMENSAVGEGTVKGGVISKRMDQVESFNKLVLAYMSIHSDYSLSQAPLMPSGLSLYTHQVAGHGKKSKVSCAMLYCPERRLVFKCLPDGARGSREIQFYESVNSKTAPEPLLLLRPYLPTYHGVFRSVDGKSAYLALSDLLTTFKRPNVCDVKLGTVSFRVHESMEKKVFEDSKYKWQRSTGFILTGVQIYDTIVDQYTRLPKMLLRRLTPQAVRNVVLVTFLGDDPQRSRELAALYSEKLTGLWHWFTTVGSQCVTFCRSSVLLAHDTDRGDSSNPETVVVALIDFSDWNLSACEAAQSDPDVVDGFAHGLSTLAEMFKQISTENVI
ncbi:unnamed protein product [Echinostoma caproni]|uniref:Kinase n=1 Tax=Echinostoma caproni TaxID=27848 RepID=A0A183AUT4_9TREM|nr:unnamed protein product [Echinostoma caproni]